MLMSQAHLGGKHSKCGDRQHYHVYMKLSLSRPKEIFGSCPELCKVYQSQRTELDTLGRCTGREYHFSAVKGQECSKEDGGDQGHP